MIDDSSLPLEQLANRILEEVSSTNDCARRLGEAGFPHGTWVSARAQAAGRGRLGRKWESRTGNLFFSMVARIEDRRLWTWVPLTTAIAVISALERLGLGSSEAEARVKWPNDLWLFQATSRGGHFAKLGGILCEAVSSSTDASFLVIGLGLNCETHPEGLDQATVSLSEAFARKIAADEVRATVIEELKNWLEKLQTRGSSRIALAYEAHAALPSGTPVEWGTPEGGIFRGEVLGLGSSAELRVKNEKGELQSLYAEDVRLRPRS